MSARYLVTHRPTSRRESLSVVVADDVAHVARRLAGTDVEISRLREAPGHTVTITGARRPLLWVRPDTAENRADAGLPIDGPATILSR